MGVYRNIGAGIKAIFLFNPAITLTDRETTAPALRSRRREDHPGDRRYDHVSISGNMHYAAGDIIYGWASATTTLHRRGLRHSARYYGPGILPHQPRRRRDRSMDCAIELGIWRRLSLLVVNQMTIAASARWTRDPCNYGTERSEEKKTTRGPGRVPLFFGRDACTIGEASTTVSMRIRHILLGTVIVAVLRAAP